MAIRADGAGNQVSLDSWKALALKGEAPRGAQLRKAFVADEVKEVEGESRSLRFRISTGSVDRDRDTIDPSGWKLSNYKKNPIVLFAHDYSSLPIAKTTKIKVEEGALVATAEFADHQFADTVFRLLKGGFLKATSVGFEPLKYQMNEERRGVDFLEQELLEFSVVPVPANPEALMEASAKGIDVGPLREWAKAVLGPQEKPRVVPPTDGKCPVGYEMGGDGQCHEKALPEAVTDCLRAAVLAINHDIITATAGCAKAVIEALKDEHDDEECPLGERCPMGKARRDAPWKNVLAEHKQDGFEVQSVLFPKAKWESADAARAWLREHDFKSGDMDESGDHYRFRQRDPADFQRIRTICLAPGRDTPLDDCRVKAVGGPLKEASEVVVRIVDDEGPEAFRVDPEEVGRVVSEALGAAVREAAGPAVRAAVMAVTGRVD